MVRLEGGVTPAAKWFVEKVVSANETVLEEMQEDLGAKTTAQLMKQIGDDIYQAAAASAAQAKFERELDERYGMFKNIILHPTSQWIAAVVSEQWAKFHLFGKPPLSLTASIFILIMMTRRKLGLQYIAVGGCLLFALNPLVVVAFMLLWKLYTGWRRLPKGYRAAPNKEPPEDLGHNRLVDDFSPSKVAGREGEAAYDHIILGSGLSGLYTAALLSRCGRRCLVLEQGEVAGGGALVRDPNGLEFETGVQTLGNVARYNAMLKPVLHPSATTPGWSQIGCADEGGMGVHSVVSVGASGAQVVFPAGRQKLIEYLVTMFPEARKTIEQLVAQMVNISNLARVFYVMKSFSYATQQTFVKYVAVPFFNYAAATAADVLTKALVQADMLAAFAAFFTAENSPAEQLSFGAYVIHSVSKWDGAFYPGRGFRGLAEAIIPTIHAAGGRVLTSANIKNIAIEQGKATGVTVDKTPISLRPGGSVISCLGAVETFQEHLHPQELKALGYPAGFADLWEARPKVHVLVGLQGNWLEDLDVTAADYYQVRDCASAMESEHNVDANSDWHRISFPTAKEPSRWTEGVTTCVITTEAGADLCKPRYLGGDEGGEKTGPVVFQMVAGKSKDKLRGRMLERLHEAYPHTEGHDESVAVVVSPRRMLSHTPERYKCHGLRAPTHIPGLFLGGEDLTMEGPEGALEAGYIAAQAVLGYTVWDTFVWQRNLLVELRSLKH